MRIIQTHSSLDYGDGVSNSMINIHHLLREMGVDASIYTRHVNEKVKQYCNPIDELNVDKNDIVLHHFSGCDPDSVRIKNYSCNKVLVYHNITPPMYFAEESDSRKHVVGGLNQLSEVANYCDYFVAVSNYNAEDLTKSGRINGEVDILPNYVNFEKIGNVQSNAIYKNVRKVVFLSVGRIAANKKQEDVINIFLNYHNFIDSDCLLYIVGNNEQTPEYSRFLMEGIQASNCRDKIIFTGKVSDEELYSYYKSADIFLCMSEHEGFCIPLLESMFFEIPTIAYDSSAVKYTMGDAGVLLFNKNYKEIAKLIQVINEDSDVRKKIIQAQNVWLKNFSKQSIETRLRKLIRKWSGEKVHG